MAIDPEQPLSVAHSDKTVESRPATAPLKPIRMLRLSIAVVAGLIIWFLPPPAGVEMRAWHLLAIFVATILGIITKPLPMGAVAMGGIAVALFTKTLSLEQALSGFSNGVVWLIVVAFFISRGFIKTGLGRRISYGFVALLGKHTLGLSYGLVASDLVLAPVIPSTTARAGGVIFPIVNSLARTFDSHPDGAGSRRIGAFLMKASFQGTIITGAMFLTGMVANSLAVELAADLGIRISWNLWAVAAIVPGLVSLVLVPWLIYVIYPPEIKKTPEASVMARERLAEMGAMKSGETILLGIFVGLLFFWSLGDWLGLSSTAVALGGLAGLLATGVLTWDDVCAEEKAWNTLIWVGGLVMLASYLNEFGFISWFSELASRVLANPNWLLTFLGLSLVYFYSHYLFASNTAHVGSMYAPFLAISVAAGTPPLLAALVLAFFSNLFSSMTHYGTGPSPIYFGSGYVEIGDWWRIGGLISVMNILIWLGIGGIWWKVLGLW